MDEGTQSVDEMDEYFFDEYVAAIIANGGNMDHKLILDMGECYIPPDRVMLPVAMMLVIKLFGTQEPWDLTNLTRTQWDEVNALLKPTEWKLCVACEHDLPALNRRHSDTIVGYYLWQREDYSNEHCVHNDEEGYVLWVIPCLM